MASLLERKKNTKPPGPHAWAWDETRESAAQFLADGQLTIEQIAKKTGAGLRSIKRWKEVPEFRARIDEHVAKFRARITTAGLALKDNRIAAKQERATKLRRVIEQRAEDYASVTVKVDGKSKRIRIPGGDTGLVVLEPKGKQQQYSVDTGLLAELRALEVEIAIEMGDWKKRIEHSGRVDVVTDEAAALAEMFTLEELEGFQKRFAEKAKKE